MVAGRAQRCLGLSVQGNVKVNAPLISLIETALSGLQCDVQILIALQWLIPCSCDNLMEIRFFAESTQGIEGG